MNFFKKIIITLTLAGFLLVPLAALAAEDYGIEATAKTSGLSSLSLSKTYRGNIPGLVGSLISGGLALIGIVFFILLLYGGIIWMSALGRTEQVDKAKQILEKAIVGLVIVSASYAVASFVFSGLSGQGQGGGCCTNSKCNSTITNQQDCTALGGVYLGDCGQCK